jgi:hypothetical protein
VNQDEIRASAEFNPEWDVQRDEWGEPVTVTYQQCWAILRAIEVVEAVRRAEGYDPMVTSDMSQSKANIIKSRLLGRMLYNGLPPTRTKPPTEVSGPAWWSLPDGDPFA